MSAEFEEKLKESFMEFLEGEDSELDFDIHAQDLNDWAWLSEFIPGIVVTSAGGIVPFQAEGLYHGHPWYYKERHGQARLNVGQKDDADAYGVDGSLFTSYMDVEEFRSGPGWISTLMTLVERLEKAPFRYDFDSFDVDFREISEERKLAGGNSYTVDDLIETDRPNIRFGICGWGHSPEEAYEDTKAISEYLFEHGYSEEVQHKMWELKKIDPTPKNKDERDFSTANFEFEVRVPEVWRCEDGSILIPEDVFKKPE